MIAVLIALLPNLRPSAWLAWVSALCLVCTVATCCSRKRWSTVVAILSWRLGLLLAMLALAAVSAGAQTTIGPRPLTSIYFVPFGSSVRAGDELHITLTTNDAILRSGGAPLHLLLERGGVLSELAEKSFVSPAPPGKREWVVPIDSLLPGDMVLIESVEWATIDEVFLVRRPAPSRLRMTVVAAVESVPVFRSPRPRPIPHPPATGAVTFYDEVSIDAQQLPDGVPCFVARRGAIAPHGMVQIDEISKSLHALKGICQ